MSTDILTIDEAKQALAQDSLDSSNESLLATYITAISRRLDEVCGPIVNRTITAEKQNGGSHLIFLKYRPVYSVSAVREYDGTTSTVLTAHTNTSQTDNQYLLDTVQGTMERMDSGTCSYFTYGKKNIEIDYVAGRGTQANIPSLFKVAAQSFLAHVWKMNQGMGTSTYGDYDGGTAIVTFALPNRVIDLLGAEIQQGPIA